MNDPEDPRYKNTTDVASGGKEKTANILADFDHLDGLIPFNDETLLGAVEALREAGRLGEVKMVSRNGTPAAVELIRAGIHHGTWDIDGPGIGATAAGLVLRALAGEDLDELCVASPIGQMITAERAKTWIPWDQRIARRPLRVGLGTGRAGAMTSWSDTPSPDLAAAAARADRGHEVGLVPVGAIEQHGPHLPVGTDTIVASALCAAAGQATGSLVLPAISLGVSYGHGTVLAGTLSLTPELLVATVHQYVRWAAVTGLRRLIFVNAHLGNSRQPQRRDGLGPAARAPSCGSGRSTGGPPTRRCWPSPPPMAPTSTPTGARPP